MEIELSSLTPDELNEIMNEKVTLSPEAKERIRKFNELLEQTIPSGDDWNMVLK